MERRRVVLLFALTLLLTVSPAFADSNVRIVRLSYIQGSVLIDQGTGQGYRRAVMNMPVSSSTRLHTGDTGLAEVQFEEGATLRLVGDTSVLFQPLTLTSKGMRVSGISVGQGTVYIKIRNARHDRFLLNVAGMPLEIGSKSHLRISADARQVFIAVFQGQLADTTSHVYIGKGNSLRIDLKTNALTDVAKGIDPFATDAWDRERERYYKNPALYSSLATTSFVMGPTPVGMSPCFAMMPGAFGVWTTGCGYWDPAYYGYSYYPYGYSPSAPSTPTKSPHPKPNPPNPHGHPMDVVGMPKTVVTLPTIAYAAMSRPAHATVVTHSSMPQPTTVGTAATFTGDRPGISTSTPVSAAKWMPVAELARPGMPVSSVYQGAPNSGMGYYGGGSYSGSNSGAYSGSYSLPYSPASNNSVSVAPSRPSVSSTPAATPAAPSAPAAPAAPVAIGRPGH